jgi:hypothetical protein
MPLLYADTHDASRNAAREATNMRLKKRMQAREKNREFTACDKCYGEIHGSGRMRAKQKQGGASNVRATQRDADGSRHAL